MPLSILHQYTDKTRVADPDGFYHAPDPDPTFETATDPDPTVEENQIRILINKIHCYFFLLTSKSKLLKIDVLILYYQFGKKDYIRKFKF